MEHVAQRLNHEIGLMKDGELVHYAGLAGEHEVFTPIRQQWLKDLQQGETEAVELENR